VTITKSITIDCTGTLGSALSSGVQGIVINATVTDKVVLRGLDINGAGVTLGTNGINLIQAASLSVFYCNIANYSNDGIKVNSTTGAHKVLVSHSQILNNLRGIEIIPTGGATVDLDVADSVLDNNTSGSGIDLASTGCTAAVHDSALTHNGVGLQVQNAGSNAYLENVLVANNGTGIFGNGEVRLGHCAVVNNTTNGLTGTTRGFQSNMIIGNGGGTNAPTASVPSQ